VGTLFRQDPCRQDLCYRSVCGRSLGSHRAIISVVNAPPDDRVGSIFDFTSYEILGTSIAFHYQLKTASREWQFTEALDFPVQLSSDIEPLARLYHLAAGLSYYKVLPAESVTSGYPLRAYEATLLAALVSDGLAEFAYVNDAPWALTPAYDLLDFPLDFPLDDARVLTAAPVSGPPLVPIGGGKDSALSLDLLQKAGRRPIGFSVGHHPSITATAAVAGVPLVTVTRHVDDGLGEATRRTGFNGHVPVTAMNSLIALIAARALGLGPVVMSNEESASEATLIWQGREVNHQYSKSGAFETLLRETIGESGADPDSYFSLLRPITELAIAQRFSELTRYHRAFTSCNRAYVRDPSRRVARWCGECAKCAFVGLILSPFIDRVDLGDILGFDVLTSKAITTYLDGLVGLIDVKPLECVGEVAEAATALQLTAQRLGDELPAYPREVLDELGRRGLMPSAQRQREVFELRPLDSLPLGYRGLLSV
jgi:hypothetical protein